MGNPDQRSPSGGLGDLFDPLVADTTGPQLIRTARKPVESLTTKIPCPSEFDDSRACPSDPVVPKEIHGTGMWEQGSPPCRGAV
jgi:hypothetical protein